MTVLSLRVQLYPKLAGLVNNTFEKCKLFSGKIVAYRTLRECTKQDPLMIYRESIQHSEGASGACSVAMPVP